MPRWFVQRALTFCGLSIPFMISSDTSQSQDEIRAGDQGFHFLPTAQGTVQSKGSKNGCRHVGQDQRQQQIHHLSFHGHYPGCLVSVFCLLYASSCLTLCHWTHGTSCQQWHLPSLVSKAAGDGVPSAPWSCAVCTCVQFVAWELPSLFPASNSSQCALSLVTITALPTGILLRSHLWKLRLTLTRKLVQSPMLHAGNESHLCWLWLKKQRAQCFFAPTLCTAFFQFFSWEWVDVKWLYYH